MRKPKNTKQAGHNHLGFSCRQHAGCRPAGDCRSAEPELGPTSPGGQSSRCRRQHRFANCNRLSARWIHALYAGPVHLRIAEGSGVQSANPAAADFTAIGFAAENPTFIVVTPSLGIKKL